MPRPQPRFHGFIGQRKHVRSLTRQLEGAKTLGEPFPNTMLFGPSGCGKTLLARALADEYGTTMIESNGYATAEDLVSTLTRLQACDFLFIDESHSLTPKSQELLYQAIDNRHIPACFDSRANEQSAEEQQATELAPTTIVLATDQPGKALNALDKRMQLQVMLGHYSLRELKEIAETVASGLDILISPQTARQIAAISQGLPRNVKHHLLKLRNHFPNADSRQLGLVDVREYMRMFDIDQRGLGRNERKYLAFLLNAKKASVETLASHIGLDTDYVRRHIETILVRQSLILIGSGGRQLTDKGVELFSKNKDT